MQALQERYVETDQLSSDTSSSSADINERNVRDGGLRQRRVYLDTAVIHAHMQGDTTIVTGILPRVAGDVAEVHIAEHDPAHVVRPVCVHLYLDRPRTGALVVANGAILEQHVSHVAEIRAADRHRALRRRL